MKPLTISILLALCFSATLASERDVSDPEVESILESASLSTRAKQIKRDAPKYPPYELRRNREAWVHVTYCIDESGAIQNVSILDSIGSEKFDKAAIETVENWRYEPALQNGKPAWQSRNEVYIMFALSDNKGGTRKFIKRFREISELLDEEKLDEADVLFQDTYENFDMSLYELSKLWAQKVRIDWPRGDWYKTEMSLHRATASHGEWIEKASYQRLLALRTEVQIRLGKYGSADHSFRDLVEDAGSDADEVVALQPTIDKMRAMIESDNVLQINAEVRKKGECNYCNNSWDFRPVRNDFTLANVQGTLRSLDMRCDNKRFESAISASVEWHIPQSWGECHIQIYGEPGTTFDVLMLPPATS